MPRWFEHAYRRGVIDMHITDHDPRFLSRFDADEYARMLKVARVQSAVIYAHSHVGLCYYPTRIGTPHPAVARTPILAEMLRACGEAGIARVVYLSAIFDTQAYRANPDWRIRDSNGNEAAARSRYGICCPNSPYREHIVGLAREVCEGYEFEGMRFDMTFWPRVCYCHHCRGRFSQATGAELPTVVNWLDEGWVRFQRSREEWLVEFAQHLTETVKAIRPQVTVEHQSSTFPLGWSFGVTERLADACDFLQGDFYGDAAQGSLVRKLFLNLSPAQPYAFETCVSVDLGNYTTLKSEELLRCKAFAAVADAGAFVFIDSIDPEGTLNPAAYERMGKVFAETEAYDDAIGGEPCRDVAVYLSTESKCDFADNGQPVDGGRLSGKLPHVDAVVSVCKALTDAHIPFGVLTRRSLSTLTGYRALVLPNVLMMDEGEAEAVRAFVAGGGALYASAWTSLATTHGRKLDDFLLADVLGVSYRGETPERFTYIAPADGHEEVLGGFTRAHPLGLYSPQMVLEPHAGVEVLGTTVLPYFDPDDPDHFASIHNNPPGRYTDQAALVLNRFGKGSAIYAAASLEAYEPHRGVFTGLLKHISGHYWFEADAPPCVEVTMFHQPDRHRFVLCLLNFQRELPNVPVHGTEVRVDLRGREPRRVTLEPKGRPIELRQVRGRVAITVPELGTFAMYAIEYA